MKAINKYIFMRHFGEEGYKCTVNEKGEKKVTFEVGSVEYFLHKSFPDLYGHPFEGGLFGKNYYLDIEPRDTNYKASFITRQASDIIYLTVSVHGSSMKKCVDLLEEVKKVKRSSKSYAGRGRSLYKKSSDEFKRIEEIQGFFYGLTNYQIEEVLFKPHVTDSEYKDVEEFLSENDNLASVEDSDFRVMFQQLQPKSEWEKLFQAKFSSDDIQQTVKTIRGFRNTVAHNKFLGTKDYEKALAMCKGLTKEIEAVIKKVESEDFALKNQEELNKIFENIRKALQPFIDTLTNLTKSGYGNNFAV